MHSSGISIEWEESTEYISLNLDSESYPSITSTREYWEPNRCFVRYNTRSEVEYGKYTNLLRVFYDHADNQHIDYNDSCWGVSEIRIKKGSSEGHAEWKDNFNPEHNGKAFWKRIGNGLYKDQKRYIASKQERQQDLFRKLLLSFDEKCCLTGESTAAALEAAHIIPSKDLGAEVAENGIILRADLHKLFDRGYFRFDPDGNVTDVLDVSEVYRGILEGSKLPMETVNRVSSALLALAK